MTETILAGALVLVAIPVYAATTLVLALGARAWSRAVQAQHEARFAQTQADVAQAADDALSQVERDRAVPRRPYVAPTESELREAIMAEREVEESIAASVRRPREFSTDGNDGIPEQPPIPEGGLYKTAYTLDA